jgi:hypothetical protein
MRDNLLIAWLAALVAGVALGAVGARWLQRRDLAHAGRRPQPLAAAPVPTAPPIEGPSRLWVPLPGNRMELGLTGFWICLRTDLTGPLYRLWSPEGRLIHEGFDLPALKALAHNRPTGRPSHTAAGSTSNTSLTKCRVCGWLAWCSDTASGSWLTAMSTWWASA